MPILRFNLSVDVSGYTKDEEVSVAAAEVTSYLPYVLATGSTDTSIPLGSIATATCLYLYSDQALTVNLNDAAGTDIPLLAKRPLTISGSAITGLYLSNASGTNANIYIIFGGA